MGFLVPQDILYIYLKFDKYIINNATIVDSNQNRIDFDITAQGILKFRR
jgi:hypothetical protein